MSTLPSKYLQYAPVVYGNYIKHNKTGVVARNGEWFECLDDLIQNKDKRKEIAENAYNRVKLKYSEECSDIWINAYRDLIK